MRRHIIRLFSTGSDVLKRNRRIDRVGWVLGVGSGRTCRRCCCRRQLKCRSSSFEQRRGELRNSASSFNVNGSVDRSDTATKTLG